jgi:hypothetical protein
MVIIVAILNWLQQTFIPALNISPEIKVLLVTAMLTWLKLFTGTKTDENKE